VEQARGQGWTSDEHFTVDGSLLEAWASAKSFRPKNKKGSPPPDDPGNPMVDYRGEKRSNETHESKSDPEAQMARKGAGKEAKLSYSGNLPVENRNGLIVDSRVWAATGTAERYAALEMLQELPGSRRVTVGGDKGFDTADFVRECRNMWVTPHVAQNLGRRGGSAIDSRTTRQMQALQHDGPALVEVLLSRQELSMPPTITLEQMKGFSLFMLRAVLSGRGDEIIDLARTNLLR